MIFTILKKFIKQAGENDQKVKDYENLFSHNLLKMEVSFGQGNSAEVAWISFLGYGQKNTHGIYPVFLYYKNNAKLILAYGVSSTNKVEEDDSWGLNQERTIGRIYGFSKYKESFVYKDYSWLIERDELTAEEEKTLDGELEQLFAKYISRLRDIYMRKSLDYRQDISDPSNKENVFSQKILFGAPGTGKSHKIDAPESEGGMGLETVGEKFKFRTTFHPDYDYAQFVGSYKPKKDKEDPKRIVYEFVPQVFAKAYAAAWNAYLENQTKPEQVYLVIEEINRGNCAQIFGDLFQLLDRKNGESEYPINADADFGQWLVDEAKVPKHEYDENGCVKIKLPPNFNILATMNTSDQSLFPMDSAFKRRFDWEYVPIKYAKAKENENKNPWEFSIVLEDKAKENKLEFNWIDFLKKINADIYTVTQSEDKQMGEFFVKPRDGKTIDLDMFRSKVLFYLWDSVYKDEVDQNKVFHFKYSDNSDNEVTFQSLFGSDDKAIEIIKKMMENLDKAYESKDGSEFKDFKIL